MWPDMKCGLFAVTYNTPDAGLAARTVAIINNVSLTYSTASCFVRSKWELNNSFLNSLTSLRAKNIAWRTYTLSRLSSFEVTFEIFSFKRS